MEAARDPAAEVRQVETARTRRLLIRILIVIDVIVPLAAIAAAIVEPLPEAIIGLVLASVGMLALCTWLAVRGSVRVPALIVCLGVMVMSIGYVAAAGFGAVQASALCFVILLSGLLLGRRAAFGSGLISAGAVVGLTWAIEMGHVVPFVVRPPQVIAISGAATFMMIATTLSWFVGEYRRAIQRLSAAARWVDDRDRAYSELVEHMRDGVVFVASNGVVESVNPATCVMTGYDADELVGKRFWDIPIIPKGGLFSLMSEFRGILSGTGFNQSLPLELKKKDGDPLFIEAESRLVNRADGSLGIHATFRNVTDRHLAESANRELEDQLRNARRLDSLGALAGGVAHDFNNLLTVILANVEILEDIRRVDAPELAELRGAAERSAELTKQLLAFGRRQVMTSKAIDLGRVVLQLEDMLRTLLPVDIELEIRVADDLHAVEADRSQIEQVVVNLAVNARDAMDGGGKLTVELDNDGGEGELAAVLLQISDTGSGIQPEILKHVFDPFFTTKHEGGTGLGLSTVYGIVKQLGGSILVNSEVGRGTVFRATFPKSDKPVEITGAEPALQRPSESVATSVLLVEDDPAVRKVARRVLQSLGYEVSVAEDAVEAMDAFRERDFDVVLSDVMMPKVSGVDLLKQMREIRPDQTVVLMSAYSRELEVEPDAFIPKPFSRNELRDALVAVLDPKPAVN